MNGESLRKFKTVTHESWDRIRNGHVRLAGTLNQRNPNQASMSTEEIPGTPSLFLSVWGAIALIASTFAVHGVRTKSFDLLSHAVWILLFVVLLVIGLALIGWVLWTEIEDLRPALITVLALCLYVLLIVVAWETPDSYRSTMAGILASLIIAVAASSRETFTAKESDPSNDVEPEAIEGRP